MYNAETCISTTVESVVSQSFSDWELLVIDDGSTDNSLNIVSALTDPRIRVISQKNQGRCSARNTGIEHACGNWIAFLDADDQLFPSAIEDLLPKKADDSDLIIGGYSTSDGIRITDAPITIAGKNFLGILLNQNNIPSGFHSRYFNGFLERTVWGKLYNARLIKSNKIKFTLGLTIGEDALFNAFIALYARKVRCIKQEVYYYDKTGAGTTRFYADKLSEWVKTFASAANTQLTPLVKTGQIKQSDLEYFIFDEYWRFFNRATTRAKNCSLAGRELEKLFADPLIASASNSFIHKQLIKNALWRFYIFLIKHQKARLAIAIGRYFEVPLYNFLYSFFIKR